MAASGSLAAGEWTCAGFLAVVFLPYEAVRRLDAVAISLVRVLITRSSCCSGPQRRSCRAGGSAGEHAGERGPDGWCVLFSGVARCALLLAVSPGPPARDAAVAARCGRWRPRSRIASASPPTPPATPSQRSRTRRCTAWLAARGSFSSDFVGPDDHWLPPDHFQERRRAVVHRILRPPISACCCSPRWRPTIWAISASPSWSSRLRSTFESLGRLERYRGHFLNWYDTRTLEPLAAPLCINGRQWQPGGLPGILRQACPAVPEHARASLGALAGARRYLYAARRFRRRLAVAQNSPAAASRCAS